MSDVGVLSCPVCRQRLAGDGSRVLCPEEHSFDIARAGYVNLTLGHGGRRRVGDTAEMVKARAEFLGAGHFAPVAGAVAEAVAAGHPGHGCLAELGSGTGAYLRAAHDLLAETAPGPPPAWGFDLSKAATSFSAPRHRDLGFAVADVESRVPLLDAAAGAVMAVFAPRPAAECARVIAPGGCLVAAFATPRHLEGLRRRWDLLSVGEGKLEALWERLAPWFAPDEAHTVEYEIELAPADVERLVAMGPNARHGGLSEPPTESTHEWVSVTVARFGRHQDPRP
jgi:SAM-dependent methyltransferase